jgi:hypothetical protein
MSSACQTLNRDEMRQRIDGSQGKPSRIRDRGDGRIPHEQEHRWNGMNSSKFLRKAIFSFRIRTRQMTESQAGSDNS